MGTLFIILSVILSLAFVALAASMTIHIVHEHRRTKAFEMQLRQSITEEDIINALKDMAKEESAEPVAEEKVEESKKEEKVEEPKKEEKKAEEKKPAKKAKKAEKVEVVAEPVVEVVPEVADETDNADDTDADDRTDRADSKSRIPFAEKMLYLDKKTQGYYNAIMNKFKSLRKINIRISSKGVSYRLGRDLVAKLTVRGKTLRLHLALDVNAYDTKVYFQKNLGDVKSYVEVPFAVKIKSDRGLKNALKLVDDLVESKGIEEKARFSETDGVEDLKVIALKNKK